MTANENEVGYAITQSGMVDVVSASGNMTFTGRAGLVPVLVLSMV